MTLAARGTDQPINTKTNIPTRSNSSCKHWRATSLRKPAFDLFGPHETHGHPQPLLHRHSPITVVLGLQERFNPFTACCTRSHHEHGDASRPATSLAKPMFDVPGYQETTTVTRNHGPTIFHSRHRTTSNDSSPIAPNALAPRRTRRSRTACDKSSNTTVQRPRVPRDNTN